MSKLKVVCAWCGKDMGEKEGDGVEGVSHGMCEECYKKSKSKEEKIVDSRSSKSKTDR